MCLGLFKVQELYDNFSFFAGLGLDAFRYISGFVAFRTYRRHGFA